MPSPGNTSPEESAEIGLHGEGRPRGLCPRAPCQGDASPWIPVFLGWGGALAPAPYLAGTPCLADTPFMADRPPTHFFVKKKWVGGRRREYPARRRELFSLRKKRTGEIRLSAWQREGSLYRLDPQPLPPLKIMGIQGESLPDAPLATHRRARDSVSRPCPSTPPEVLKTGKNQVKLKISQIPVDFCKLLSTIDNGRIH